MYTFTHTFLYKITTTQNQTLSRAQTHFPGRESCSKEMESNHKKPLQPPPFPGFFS